MRILEKCSVYLCPLYYVFIQLKRLMQFCRESIYKFSLFVCLYPINVKTAEPIGTKFFVGPYVMIEFSNICLQQNLIFENFENSRFLQKHNPLIFLFVFVLQCILKENMFTIEIEDWRDAS